MDRLTEAEESIAKIEAQLKGAEGKDADSLRKMSKAMTDSVKNIRQFINGKPQEKQGYGTPYQLTVNSRMREARSEILNKNKIPDAQEIRLVEMAETIVQQAVDKTNSFFNSKWMEYRKLSEVTPVKVFKEIKEIE